jgi:23S rRNA (adenine-N6)-dimethyltransferase
VAGGPASPLQRQWGFHRLTEPWAARLVAASGVRPGELVLDVGAGTGVLTAALVTAGARVIAVELHPGRLGLLRARFAGQPVRVVRADAADLRLPRRPFRVVANPPYGVSAALLRRLLARGSAVRAADLVLPRPYVVQLLTGRRAGAARWAEQFELRRGLSVPRAAFRPAARTDAAVLVIRRRVWR